MGKWCGPRFKLEASKVGFAGPPQADGSTPNKLIKASDPKPPLQTSNISRLEIGFCMKL
jgi:hypothetical protein